MQTVVIQKSFCFQSSRKAADHNVRLWQFIIHDLHSGATIYEAIGAYNMEKRREIITIVDKGEYQKLMKFINQKDPKAFITVYNVSNMRYQPKKSEYFSGRKKLPGQNSREIFLPYFTGKYISG